VVWAPHPFDNFNVYAFPPIRKKPRMDGAPSFMRSGSVTAVEAEKKWLAAIPANHPGANCVH
jgi:hypothetical protein